MAMGKYMGHPVSRNPFTWIPIFLYGLVLIPFTVLIYPILLLLMWFGLTSLERNGYDANVTDYGVEVFSRKEGPVSSHEWGEITMVITRFNPPVLFPELILRDGSRIKLQLADVRKFKDPCRLHGVPFNEKPC